MIKDTFGKVFTILFIKTFFDRYFEYDIKDKLIEFGLVADYLKFLLLE